MIFVTVGSWQFDGLVRTLDESVAAGLIGERVLMQIANGKYLPKHCDYFRSKPSLNPYYDQARLVVAHGGTGTTLEVLDLGLPLVSVANPSVQDNHQHEFLLALQQRGYLTYCQDVDRLPGVVSDALGMANRPHCLRAFFSRLLHDLERFDVAGTRRLGWLARLAGRSLVSRSIPLEAVKLEDHQVTSCPAGRPDESSDGNISPPVRRVRAPDAGDGS